MKQEAMLNPLCLDSVCAGFAYAMGMPAPQKAQVPAEALTAYVDHHFGGEKANRVFLYHPDAVAEWIFRKYPEFLYEAMYRTELELPLQAVMPSVTPVCFGTLYTGAQPEVHGIRKYEKPVIKIDTLFDALLRAGKKPAIIADSSCSMGKIFLERDMDYFIFDSIPEITAKATELILADTYDFIAVYHGNYDSTMHKNGPEAPASLAELKANAQAFALFSELIKSHWKRHNTLVGFAMDHGCHEIDGNAGSHGLDMPEDLNIVHLYKAYPREK
ncbi:MAG TPA: hypothetical protein GX701_03860 [Clostridiales bacterium]|jgi:predicted AlkP superfamily pyrophosphatase or phosphodiesterase|nr:hypothetical protein [Clostridiales bacterium]